uniref:RING-type domain-containing protein n=1 Tax=viral metagenome TaxID=1070528 RepID=A0A6C0KI08_9ZZZZ
MSNQFYNVYEFDAEMMNFADELLRQYPNINDIRSTHRAGTAPRQHNQVPSRNVERSDHSIYAAMSEYNNNIHEYNVNMRLFLDIMMNNSRSTMRDRAPGVSPQMNYAQHIPQHIPQQIPQREFTRPAQRYRYTPSTLLSYVLSPNRHRVFEDVIVSPSEQQITNATQIIDYSSENEYNNINCPITLDEFTEGEQICRIRHCGHIFKEQALRNWFQRNVRCPVCRYDIRNYIPRSSTDSSNNVVDDSDSESEETLESVNQRTTDISSNRISTTNTGHNQFTNTLSNNLINIITDYVNNHLEPSIFDASYNVTHTFELPIMYYSDNSGYYFTSDSNV